MKTITLNGQTLKITAAEQRALEILQREGYAARRSEFVEGPVRWEKFIVPRTAERRAALGIVEARKHLPQPETINGYTFGSTGLTNAAMERRHAEFFAKHPRCDNVVLGDPRRINAILRKVALGNKREDYPINAALSGFNRWY